MQAEISAEEAAIHTQEHEKALHDIGEEQLQPPAPFDLGSEHIPAPGDNADLADSIPQKQAAEQAEKDKSAQEPPATEEQAPAKKGRGKPPKADKAEKASDTEKPDKPKKPARAPRPPKAPKEEKATTDTVNEEAPAPAEPEQPPAPRDATRGETEQVVYINLSELRPFKDHPFGVRDDAEMKSLVESVKAGGVNQPALVRPHPDGNGYEIIAGHRRQKASELAAYANMPCIVRNMTDEEAILAMTDDNLKQREEILPSEKAVSLKMQVDATKRQGARDTSGQDDQNKGKTVYDIVAERNSDKGKPMSSKQVQRYISLTKLVPDLRKMVDDKTLGFTPAVEFSFISRKNQNLIAVSIEGEQSKPSLSQAQRLRQLDKEGKLNGDVIDGILSEEKKEVDKVIISGAELNKYFGKDKTPREMKDQIIKLLDEWAGKEKAHTAPEKQQPDR